MAQRIVNRPVVPENEISALERSQKGPSICKSLSEDLQEGIAHVLPNASDAFCQGFVHKQNRLPRQGVLHFHGVDPLRPLKWGEAGSSQRLSFVRDRPPDLWESWLRCMHGRERADRFEDVIGKGSMRICRARKAQFRTIQL